MTKQAVAPKVTDQDSTPKMDFDDRSPARETPKGPKESNNATTQPVCDNTPETKPIQIEKRPHISDADVNITEEEASE